MASRTPKLASTPTTASVSAVALTTVALQVSCACVPKKGGQARNPVVVAFRELDKGEFAHVAHTEYVEGVSEYAFKRKLLIEYDPAEDMTVSMGVYDAPVSGSQCGCLLP